MIRWTEHTEFYRLEYSHRLQAVVCGALSVFMCLVAVVGIVGVLGALMDGPWARCVPFLILTAIAVPLAWVAGRLASAYESKCGWVEVSIRGCTARWGGRLLPSMEAPLPIFRFQVFYDARARGGIEAILPDGGRRLLLGPWEGDDAVRLLKLSEELNANLGSVESSAATLAPPPARLEGPPDAATRRTLAGWRLRSGPYRVVVFDGRSLIAVPAIALALGLLGWGDSLPAGDLTFAVAGTCALSALWWGLFLRHLCWIEIDAPGGRTRWGRGGATLGEQIAVASFHAEPYPSILGRDDYWTIVAYQPDGQRIVPFARALRVPRRKAIRSAYLLNWALKVGESRA